MPLPSWPRWAVQPQAVAVALLLRRAVEALLLRAPVASAATPL